MGRLFGTAGIRGPYLEKITPELTYRVGLSLAAYVGGRGSATVGHDVRTTSPLLAQLAAAGLMAGGLDAIYLGLVPTPVLAYSVPHTRSRAGIIITASHNPPSDNGLKIFDDNGMEYTQSMESDLERLILTGDLKALHAPWNGVGKLIVGTEIVEEYVRDLVDRMRVHSPRIKLRVGVDCANGAASGVTPRVLRQLGVGVVSFNCHPDGLFPGRCPEPRPDVLREYIKGAESLGLDALLAHDGDADRLALAVPGRAFVKQDLLIALFAKHKLEERKGTIIVSVDVGIEVDEVVEKLGGKVVRAKLGKTHEKLKETPGALMAAEPWKLIDPSWGLWVDAIYQAALLVKLSLESGKKPAQLIEELPSYPSARISVKLGSDDEKQVLYEKLEEEVLSAFTRSGKERVTDIDGVRIDFDEGSWILVRKSGTEPKIRIYGQARSRDKLKELVEEVRRLLICTADRLGVKIQGVEEHIDLGR
ncbi:phosphohexomutase domain-containing protein [Stetteria hydrogenophila]